MTTEFGNARQGRASAPSAAGARPEGYEILMDDESILNFFRRGVGTITGSSLGMEAIAEFQTLTNTYGAQFGGNGAVVNTVTKSGTKRFPWIRVSVSNATAPWTRAAFSIPSVIPSAERNPAAVSAAPLKKDKMFFFFNYEGIWHSRIRATSLLCRMRNHRTPTFSQASNPAA